MQIVIDIDDMAHDWLVNGFPDEDDMEMALKAIKNGTVLPDNHGRLIDADALRLSDLAPEPWYRPYKHYIRYQPRLLRYFLENGKERGMSRPPLKALEQIKRYCEKTQCRRCAFGERDDTPYDDLDFVGCKLQRVTPCDWETGEEESGVRE